MIGFTGRQRRIPSPARTVFLVGAGTAPLTSGDPGLAASASGCDADPAALLGYVQAVALGRDAARAGEDARIAAALGAEPLACVAVEGEGGALSAAWWAVASGAADAVLLVGWDDGAVRCAILAETEAAHTVRRDPAGLWVASGSSPTDPGQALDWALGQVRGMAGEEASGALTRACVRGSGLEWPAELDGLERHTRDEPLLAMLGWVHGDLIATGGAQLCVQVERGGLGLTAALLRADR